MNTERIWTLLARKLSGEATQAEILELADLLKKYPEIDVTAKYLNEFWQIPVENDHDFLEATFHLHSERLKEKGFDLEIDKQETGSLNLDMPLKQIKLRKLILMGSTVIMTAAVIFFSFFTKNFKGNNTPGEKITTSEVSTKNGSRSKLQLPDGTAVWLNSGSKLVYSNEHFGVGIREVSLIGEAYFDVVKNPVLPFVIHTAKMDIKVLGTAFNVKCYPGDKNTETSLIRGSIEVTLKDRAEKIYMKPNEKLILSNDNIKPIKINTVPVKHQPGLKSSPIIELGHLTLFPKDSSIVETGWVENRLVFSEESLEDIAKKMERWYGVNIKINNDKLKKELLTGSFENETISQALDALQITTPFTYKINKNVITISK